MTSPPASNAQQTHQCRRLELGRHLPELLRPLQQQVSGRRSLAIHHPPRLARLRPPPRPMPRSPPPTAPACGWSGGLRSWRATPASAPMHVMARCWAARWVGSVREARNALACHPVNLPPSRTPCIAAKRFLDWTVTHAASSHFPKSRYKPSSSAPLARWRSCCWRTLCRSWPRGQGAIPFLQGCTPASALMWVVLGQNLLLALHLHNL